MRKSLTALRSGPRSQTTQGQERLLCTTRLRIAAGRRADTHANLRGARRGSSLLATLTIQESTSGPSYIVRFERQERYPHQATPDQRRNRTGEIQPNPLVR